MRMIYDPKLDEDLNTLSREGKDTTLIRAVIELYQNLNASSLDETNINFPVQNSYLGYAQITTSFTTGTSGSYVDVTGLTTTVIVPAGGRRVKITFYVSGMSTNAAATCSVAMSIFEGATQITYAYNVQAGTDYAQQNTAIAVITPTVGSHTYKAAIYCSTAGTLSLFAGTSAPAFILVELI